MNIEEFYIYVFLHSSSRFSVFLFKTFDAVSPILLQQCTIFVSFHHGSNNYWATFVRCRKKRERKKVKLESIQWLSLPVSRSPSNKSCDQELPRVPPLLSWIKTLLRAVCTISVHRTSFLRTTTGKTSWSYFTFKCQENVMLDVNVGETL